MSRKTRLKSVLLLLFVDNPVPKVGGPGLLNRTIPRKMKEEDMT